MIDPRDLASAMKELRGRRTQREAAKQARIDPATWNAYEKGVRNPRRPERLRQIAEGLGVEVIALQNAITEQSARRMAQESSSKVSRDVSYKNPPYQARTDLNEMCRLVEEEMAEITRHLTKLILLIMEGRPRNS